MPTLTGIAYWASVQKPNTTFEPCWTIDLVLDKSDADDLKERINDYADSPKISKPKITLDEEKGGYIVKIKLRCERADGTLNDPPRVIGADGEPLTKLIGNGSKVKVLYNMYKSSYKNKEFIKLGLKAVKVLELVSYGDPEDESFFEPEKNSKNSKTEGSEDFDDDL